MKAKDYNLIAQTIKRQGAPAGMHGHYARILADAFEAEDPKFKREQFLRNCGVEKVG